MLDTEQALSTESEVVAKTNNNLQAELSSSHLFLT